MNRKPDHPGPRIRNPEKLKFGSGISARFISRKMIVQRSFEKLIGMGLETHRNFGFEEKSRKQAIFGSVNVLHRSQV